MNMRCLVVSVVFATWSGVASAQLLPPTPYRCFSDSPFRDLSLGYFYLETFEDHALNVPGVSADQGGPTSVVFGPSIHDSVDCDDGAIDNSGLLGDSFFTGGGSAGIRFTFSAAVLGTLPTHAGIVWTDGGQNAAVTFEAFDAGGVSLGVSGAVVGDASFNGTCDEDRFFGVIHDGGISAIVIRHNSGGLEVDHLQYGGGGSACRCPADFDGSGGTPDVTDIDAFFTAWLLGESAADADCSGGTPDTTDIDAFFGAWLVGGC